MGFEKDVIDGCIRRRNQLDISQAKLARMTGENQASISRWELGQASPALKNISAVVEVLGGRIVWPDQGGMSVALTVDVKGRGSGEWRSVPVISWQTIGRHPRRAIGKEEVVSYVFQNRTHSSMAGHEDVVAVIVGEHRAGMVPTVLPNDTLFVDLGLRTMQSSAISIFCDPSGELRVCRVTGKKAGTDTLFLVTEDAKPGQTDVFSLANDFGGRQLDSVLIGEVTGLIR